MIKVRFAPSPSGYLHVGNVKLAIFNWLFLLSNRINGVEGSLLLRIDDTNSEKSKDEYIAGIKEDLSWLGISWDETFAQSSRLSRYDECFAALKDAGRVYPCYETEEELEEKRKRQLARHLPPIYDRSALKLTDEDRAIFELNGKKPHWRFKLDSIDVVFDDLIKGECHFDMKHLSDPVIMREDGTYLYNFPSVVDDIDSEITHIIRGQDHLTNTAIQTQIFKALKATFMPKFAHYPMLLNQDGHKFSKRNSDIAVRNLRGDGILPQTLFNVLAGLGSNQGGKVFTTVDELARTFNLSGYGSSVPRFDMETFGIENARLIRILPFELVKDLLQKIDSRIDVVFWDMVRGNISTIEEIKVWVDVCFGEIARPSLSDTEWEFLSIAGEELPTGSLDNATMKNWATILTTVTSKKGRELFHPIRLALTGLEFGPELSQLVPIMGRETILKRIKK